MSTTIAADIRCAYETGHAEGLAQGFLLGAGTALGLAAIAALLRWLLS